MATINKMKAPHHAGRQALPAIRMRLAHNKPAAKPPPPVPVTPVAKPSLVRQSSSANRIVNKMVNACEMRYKSLRDAFRFADRDSSGGLTRDELQTVLNLWRIQAQGRHIDQIMAIFDRNGDDTISYSEFCDGLKRFSVTSQPIFGLADSYVTDRHRVIRGDNRVILNDNLGVAKASTRSQARPDFELYELPHTRQPVSPEAIKDHTIDLQNRIHGKYRNLRDAFRAFDEDKDGRLSKQELIAAVRGFNLPIPHEHVMQIADLCDANADGKVDYLEFATVLKRKDALGH